MYWRKYFALCLVSGLVACSSCTHSAPTLFPPVAVDGGTQNDGGLGAAKAACANVARVGCSDGKDANCAAVLDNVVATSLTGVSLSCLTTAQTQADVRLCGLFRCP